MSKFMDSLRESLANIKYQLMADYDKGASMGKYLKKTHKDKVKNIVKKEEKPCSEKKEKK